MSELLIPVLEQLVNEMRRIANNSDKLLEIAEELRENKKPKDLQIEFVELEAVRTGESCLRYVKGKAEYGSNNLIGRLVGMAVVHNKKSADYSDHLHFMIYIQNSEYQYAVSCGLWQDDKESPNVHVRQLLSGLSRCEPDFLERTCKWVFSPAKGGSKQALEKSLNLAIYPDGAKPIDCFFTKDGGTHQENRKKWMSYLGHAIKFLKIDTGKLTPEILREIEEANGICHEERDDSLSHSQEQSNQMTEGLCRMYRDAIANHFATFDVDWTTTDYKSQGGYFIALAKAILGYPYTRVQELTPAQAELFIEKMKEYQPCGKH